MRRTLLPSACEPVLRARRRYLDEIGEPAVRIEELASLVIDEAIAAQA